MRERHRHQNLCAGVGIRVRGRAYCVEGRKVRLGADWRGAFEKSRAWGLRIILGGLVFDVYGSECEV